jgi:UDP-N-acetylmuramoyl-tripeptide--D-alanyl-D-alanine ligase
MRGWDAARVASAAGAQLAGEPALSGGEPGPWRAVIDSREVRSGDLFVGLVGEYADGGSFAAQALAAGAWGVLVTPEHAEAIGEAEVAAEAIAAVAAKGAAEAEVAAEAGGAVEAEAATEDKAFAAAVSGAAVLAHSDPLVGLQSLARAWRRELGAGGAKVVAITGSTGKTSTKDILSALLGSHLRTVASPGNFNTEIGLPLAVLAAAGDTEALVLEMAMRGKGQIAELADIAEPDVGVIVNVGPVHLELLGSIEAIAAAKAELIAGLAPGATAVIPAAEPLLARHARADLRTVTFGEGGDVVLEETPPDGEIASRRDEGAEGAAGEVMTAGEVVIRDGEMRMVLRPSFAQRHNLRNLLAAVAAARALGITPEGRVDVSFSALRGERIALPGGIFLINDCYNANPMSMRAAIDDLAETAPTRRVAVLGDMLELGREESRLHREIGEHAAERGLDVLVTVGPLAAAMSEAFAGAPGEDGSGIAPTPREVHSVPDAAAAAELLRTLLREGDTVLVKGSRGVGLERVAESFTRGPDARTPREPVEDAPVVAPSAGPGRR